MNRTSSRLVSLGTLGALLAIAALAWSARADDNYFGYVYGTETESRGHGEVYQWITGRFGKTGGRYRAGDFATEFEYGLTDRLQASFSLNAERHQIHAVPGFDDVDRSTFRGVQAALKYLLTSPDHGRLGVAFYLEPGYARIDKIGGDDTREYELETKLLLQKEYRGGRVIWAGNVIAEGEREQERAGSANHLELEFSHGIAFRLAPGWYAGVENRWRSAFSQVRFNAAPQGAVYLGPTLHYDDERWWFTFTVLPQIFGWPHSGAGHLQLTEFERLELRLKVGFDL